MAPVNLDEMAANTLDSSNMLLVLGEPKEDEFVQLTGTINGTNKEFTFPATHYPIYPKNGRTIAPLPADVIIITRKGTTDTSVTVASLKTITDPTTGFTVYAIVELQAAPTAEGADGVYGKCVVERDVYVQQNVKPSIEQDTKDIGRMGSKNLYTKYGGIKTSYEVEIILSDLQMALIGNYEEYTGTETVETGHTLYELMDNPLLMHGYVPIFSGDEEDDPLDRELMGRVILRGVRKAPVLPEGSVGDDLTATLKLTVGEKPRILAKNAA